MGGSSRLGTLGLASRAVDFAVTDHHRLRLVQQLLELRRLPRGAARDFVEIAGNIGNLDTQIADPARQFGNQRMFAVFHPRTLPIRRSYEP